MRNGLAAALVLSWLCLAAPAHADDCTLAGLAWMKGVWHDQTDSVRVEERWTIGPDDRLIGSSWLLHPGRPGGVIEAIAIVAEDDHLALRIRHFNATLAHSREEKDAPMLFITAHCAKDFVIFDGQGDRLGEHMTYRRDGDRLTFIGDFIHQGQPVRVEETFAKVAE